MVPRPQIHALDLSGKPSLLRRQLATSYHTRLPVYEGSPDQILGILHLKNVVGLMQQASSRPVETFSIGFDDPAFDVSEYAAVVARRLGTQQARVPIIFLTARDATDDKVRGLTIGGDDYVTKPFSLEELVARVRSLLRRAGLAAPESNILTF